MRLTEFEQQTIKELTKKYFGEDAHMWLFGSRVDDHAKGGDIDLYLQTNDTDVNKLFEERLDFLVELKEKIGDQKIDLVIHRLGTEKILPIYKVAQLTGIIL